MGMDNLETFNIGDKVKISPEGFKRYGHTQGNPTCDGVIVSLYPRYEVSFENGVVNSYKLPSHLIKLRDAK